MKREAEQRLQQAQARDNQARAALAAVEAGQAVLAEDGAFLDQAEGQLKSNIVGYPESDDDEASNARESDALAELQRQLNYLRNEFSSVPESRPRNNTENDDASIAATGGGGAATVMMGQRQQLEDKLQDLQQKKQSMDQLLQQLQSLRSHRLDVLNNGEQGDANPLLSVVEAQEKLQKLQEVRQRLNQLRDLVQYYQKMKTQAEPDGTEQEEEQPLMLPDEQVPQ
nr:hypothetical protein BaRGS_026092 [Batillaria attramentaria]